jgi:hypothetical protein
MEESYLNSYSPENNKLQFLTDENKNSEFIIDVNLTKMFTLNVKDLFNLALRQIPHF